MQQVWMVQGFEKAAKEGIVGDDGWDKDYRATLAEAEAEALRLCKETGGAFYVFKAVALCEPSTPKWTRIRGAGKSEERITPNESTAEGTVDTEVTTAKPAPRTRKVKMTGPKCPAPGCEFVGKKLEDVNTHIEEAHGQGEAVEVDDTPTSPE